MEAEATVAGVKVEEAILEGVAAVCQELYYVASEL